eukprot:gene8288-5807_t
MTAPPHPFAPTLQASTSMYLPHPTVALDLLPPYHGFAFQEKDLSNEIIRPHDAFSGAALEAAQEWQDRRRQALKAERRRDPPPQGFSFLSLPTESSAESSQEATPQEIICAPLPAQKRSAVAPIWKSRTNIPPATALLGTVALFRPTLPERQAGLELHRRQRRQRYPPPAPPREGPTKEEVEDYVDTLRDNVEPSKKIEEALQMLDSPTTYAKKFRARAEAARTGTPQPKSSAPVTLTVPLQRATYMKLADTAQQRKPGRRTQKSRGVDNEAVEEEEEGVDPNVNAIKLLFERMKKGQLDDTEPGDAQEEREEARTDEEGIRGAAGSDRLPYTAWQARQVSTGDRPAGLSSSFHSLCDIVPHSARFSFSATNMFDIPRPVFDQVPRGSARSVAALIRRPASESGQGPELPPEVAKHLKWLLYKEEYDRTLIYTEEQETSPIPYYGSFVAPPGEPALVERLRHPPALRDVDILHRGVDAALDRTIAEVLALQEQRPPRESTPLVTAPNPVDTFYTEVMKAKTAMFEEYAALHGQLRSRLDLFQEEKRARLEVLSQFISCKYPKPCRCLLWDMEILEESNVELEPAVPPTCVFVSVVLSLSHVIQTDLLERRQRELDGLKKVLDCLYLSSYVYERFVEDERRQWQKLVLYHQYCMQLASRHHPTAATWCEERGLETLEEGDDDEVESAPPPACHKNNAAVLPPPTTTPQKLELKAMRRSRLQFLGPNDSPFCSYVKFLEVIITTVLEQDGRQNVITQEKRAVSRLLGRMCCSFAQASLLTQERERREHTEVASLLENEAIQRDFIEWQAVVPGVRMLEEERFARQDLLAVEVVKAEGAARRGYEQIMSECTTEYLDLWRRIHNELLVLKRNQMTETEERELVQDWALEAPRQYVESEQSRHRMKVMVEREREYSLLTRCFTWMKVIYIPARDRLELYEEYWARQQLLLFMEEGAKRIRLMYDCEGQRIALFERKLVGEEDTEAVKASMRKRRHTSSRRRQRPAAAGLDLNIRRRMVSNLSDFATTDEIADIFSNDHAIQQHTMGILYCYAPTPSEGVEPQRVRREGRVFVFSRSRIECRLSNCIVQSPEITVDYWEAQRKLLIVACKERLKRRRTSLLTNKGSLTFRKFCSFSSRCPYLTVGEDNN